MENFAMKLRELREAAGLTQQQLADAAGMHVMSVAKLEHGAREPAWSTVQALAGALGIDCGMFAKDVADPDREPAPRGRPAKKVDETPKKRGKK